MTGFHILIELIFGEVSVYLFFEALKMHFCFCIELNNKVVFILWLVIKICYFIYLFPSWSGHKINSRINTIQFFWGNVTILSNHLFSIFWKRCLYCKALQRNVAFQCMELFRRLIKNENFEVGAKRVPILLTNLDWKSTLAWSNKVLYNFVQSRVH